ncbi:MAG: hypothetical protein CVT88_06440, partial [Candidatus Altiarchaeales archaeon HGW-Altiarchaeales-1]
LQEKVMNEICLIPLEKLNAVYDIIHFFRVGLERSKSDTNKILEFAGCWKDMPDEKFNSFTKEIGERRKQAFLSRER